jgi:hypothetical protein
MIDIGELTENDKGASVVYENGYKREFGVVSSWNDHFIFVKYGGSQQSQATSPEHLTKEIENA